MCEAELGQVILQLNSNIRCIEMRRDYIFDEKIGLNSNIRCIEMLKFEECMTFKEKLNSNIRCIEIYMHELQDRVRNG